MIMWRNLYTYLPDTKELLGAFLSFFIPFSISFLYQWIRTERNPSHDTFKENKETPETATKEVGEFKTNSSSQ
jgi:hypothetical protein